MMTQTTTQLTAMHTTIQPPIVPFIDIMSSIPRVEFNVSADKISDVHQRFLPANCSALETVKVVSCKVKLLFTEALSKGKVATAVATPATKQRALITPARALTLPSPSLSTLCPCGMDTPSAMLLHQDITPHHAYHWTSILQPIYKRPPPHDIVWL
jgi:hypothetical protein